MENKGKIVISPNVIKQIILETLKEIPEVLGVSKPKSTFFKGNTNSIGELEVEMTETECVIDLSVILEYGSKLVEVGNKIQDKLVLKIEELSSIKVKEININIAGIEKKVKKYEKEEKGEYDV